MVGRFRGQEGRRDERYTFPDEVVDETMQELVKVLERADPADLAIVSSGEGDDGKVALILFRGEESETALCHLFSTRQAVVIATQLLQLAGIDYNAIGGDGGNWDGVMERREKGAGSGLEKDRRPVQ